MFWGYAPRSAFGPNRLRAKPIVQVEVDGEAQPRLTSGGEAATAQASDTVSDAAWEFRSEAATAKVPTLGASLM
jgi:hypothetical protein